MQREFQDLRWEAVRRTVGLTGSQKVNFLQKRSAQIYVFAFLAPFAPFLAGSSLIIASFSARPGAHLNYEIRSGMITDAEGRVFKELVLHVQVNLKFLI